MPILSMISTSKSPFGFCFQTENLTTFFLRSFSIPWMCASWISCDAIIYFKGRVHSLMYLQISSSSGSQVLPAIRHLCPLTKAFTSGMSRAWDAMANTRSERVSPVTVTLVTPMESRSCADFSVCTNRCRKKERMFLYHSPYHLKNTWFSRKIAEHKYTGT
jgi:hypothetical protein